MDDKDKKPDWTPENAGCEFASRVKAGLEGGHDGLPGARPGAASPPAAARRAKLSVDDYVNGVLAGERTIIARAITLVESNAPAHMAPAQEMLKRLLPHTGQSIRVGVTGVPGAGKSTFIEALGNHLCDLGRRVAVLAVDPSSSVTRGSILGDKTRMEKLCGRSEAFIRPSPTGGTLGGVARKSRETLLVCEAAGFDVVLVETVGVGQSEITVRSMVDFFLLVLIAGAGDELQGIKRGIMELCDAILINKADGDNKVRAQTARGDLERALGYLQPATEGWRTGAYTCSSLNGEGIVEIWSVIEEFRKITTSRGVFDARRRSQTLAWIDGMVQDHLRASFEQNKGVRAIRPEVERAVLDGRMSPTMAVKKLVERYEQGR